MTEERDESEIHRRVRSTVDAHVAKLVLAVRVLRIPAVLIGIPAIPALIGTTILAATADGWWRIGWLVACLAGWVILALWWIRIKRYSDAISDPDELAAQLVQVFAMFDTDGDVFTRLLAVFERGGLRVLYRLRALWRVASIPDHITSSIEEAGRARWFIPPMPATTALRFTLLLWTTAISWFAMIVLIVLRIAGVQ